MISYVADLLRGTIMQENNIMDVLDAINYVKELYAFYYNDRNDKMASRFDIKRFSGDSGKAYQSAMDQILNIHKNMSQIYNEYKKNSSSGTTYVFSKALNEKEFNRLAESIFAEFAKLESVNIIADLQDDIKNQITWLRKHWKINEVVVSTWKDYVGKDDEEALKRLREENEMLKKKLAKLSQKKQIAMELGYISDYSIPTNTLLLEVSNEKR